MDYLFPNLPLVFTVILFILLALQIHRRPKTNGSRNLPPGPMKLPIIGNIHNLIGSLPHRRLRELSLKYGPLIHLQLGEVPVVAVSSPEAAEAVMKTYDIVFAQRHIMTYGSSDIAFSHGKYWRQLRELCTTELLSSKRANSFRSIREEEVASVINSVSLSAGSPVNLTKKVFSLTYCVTGRAAFGRSCDEFIAAIEEFTKLGSGFGLADVFPSFKLFHAMTGIEPKLEKLRHQCDMILDRLIGEHMANGKDSEDNLLRVLLNLKERGDLEFPLTNDTIKAVIFDMFSVGGETSSTTVDWAMAEMIKNPRIMNKAQSEVRKVFGAKCAVDEEGLKELTFLKCVIKETLRLHPPLPFALPRECQEQCKINGYDIPLKTKVIVNLWGIGRDPRHWIKPDTFYPERFLDSSVNFKGADFEFVPFGGGRRICPGMSFALPNLELQLANFLYYFDWKVGGGVKNEDIDMIESFGGSLRRQNDLSLIAIPYQI